MSEPSTTLVDRLRPHVPLLSWFPSYHRSWFRKDLIAGLVVAALMIPQAFGYAGIAGVPVQVGLYAIPLALLAYALLGTSRQLIVGPVSTISVLSGSLVLTQAAGNPALAVTLTSGLAVAAGIWLVVAGLLGLGWLAEFLSKPIVTGFVFGLTMLIVVGELPYLLGVAPTHGDFFARLGGLASELGDINSTTALVGAVSLGVLFGGSVLAPRVPWGLIVLIGGIVVSEQADLSSYGVATVGEVPAGIPTPLLPDIPVNLIPWTLVGGAAIALVGLAEGMSAARLFAQQRGSGIRADQELIATGAANLGAGFSGGLGVAGSLSKTAAVDRSGGGSQVVGLVAAGAAVLTLVLFVGSLAPLPRAVLSAIVVHAVWRLMDLEAIRRYAKIRRNDLVACLVALGGVLVFGTLYGLLIAIAQSVLGLVYRSTKVSADVMGRIEGEKAAWGSVSRHPEREQAAGLLVLRLNAPIFWVNAQDIHQRILDAVDDVPGTKALILDLESTNQLDTTSCDMLEELLEDLTRRGVDLYLVRVFHFVRGVLKRSGLEERIGQDRMWHTISAGVKKARVQSLKEQPALEIEDTAEVERIAVDDFSELDPESDGQDGKAHGHSGKSRSQKSTKASKQEKKRKKKSHND